MPDTMIATLRTDTLMARIYAGDAADHAHDAREWDEIEKAEEFERLEKQWTERARQMEQRLAYWTTPVSNAARDRNFRGIVG